MRNDGNQDSNVHLKCFTKMITTQFEKNYENSFEILSISY